MRAHLYHILVAQTPPPPSCSPMQQRYNSFLQTGNIHPVVETDLIWKLEMIFL